jgi:predicted dehydrogenase
MTPLRIGLIGCGNISQRAHLPNLMSLPKVELVAFADPDESRRAMTARIAPNAAALPGHQELLDEIDLDAVVVCVPNFLHAETTMAALNRGLHVYLEKPLAITVDDALALVEARAQAAVTGMMGFNYRLNKLYQDVRTQLASGALGKPLMARTVFSTAAKKMSPWKLARQSGGGVLLDLASHHLDLIRYLFDREVIEVFAVIESRRGEDDTAWLQMRLTDGLIVQSFFSSAGAEEDSLEIYCEAGKLIVDRYRSLTARATRSSLERFRLNQMKESLRSLANAPYGLNKMRAAAQEPSYYAALQNFVGAVSRGEDRAPNFRDGYQNLLIIEAAEQSARLGSKVQVGEN